MIRSEFDELQQHVDWQQVLADYRDRTESTRVQQAEFDGWVDRVEKIESVDADRLSRIHGKLIALGYLKFQITGRTTGMRYQISPQGREALDRLSASKQDVHPPGLPAA